MTYTTAPNSHIHYKSSYSARSRGTNCWRPEVLELITTRAANVAEIVVLFFWGGFSGKFFEYSRIIAIESGSISGFFLVWSFPRPPEAQLLPFPHHCFKRSKTSVDVI